MPNKQPTRPAPGARALWDWMSRRGLNQREAAVILKMHFMSLNQILHGVRRPGLAVALRIEEHTGVPAGIWMHTRVSPRRRRKTAPPVSAYKQDGNSHVG